MADGSSGPAPQCNYIVAYSEGPCYQAIIQYGDNGAGSSPELIVNGNGGQFTWQASKVVNFSGSASIEFAVHAGGGADLTASKGTQIAGVRDNSLTHQYITDVQVGAAVIAVPRRRMAWTGLAIK